MSVCQVELRFVVEEQGMLEITREIEQVVRESEIDVGLCTVFVLHSSASLVIQENADPSARADLEDWFSRLVPEGDLLYSHCSEGPDDMPAHIRSILSNMDLTIPITDGRSALGTWQGIYLWEHRTRPHRRRVTVTIQ